MIATAVCNRLLLLAGGAASFGTVHSVFDHAVNLELKGRVGLVGLIAESRVLTPYAVSVRTDEPFLEAGVRAGMAAAIQGGRITLEEANLALDLRTAEPQDLCVDSIAIHADGAARSALTGRIAACLDRADPAFSLAPLATGRGENTYTRFLAPRLERLRAAVSAGTRDAAIETAGRMAGCGMGLTPSSDDLLTGYFLTHFLLCRGERTAHLRDLIPRMAQAAAEKTNRVSATFLLQSGEGLANRAVFDLFRSVFQFHDEAAAGRAIERILTIGATSGADMLTGVSLALQE